MEDIAEKIIIGIVIASISSFITVRLSLRRFRSEKWWERKIDAYSKVIEAFHHVKVFSDAHLNAESKGKELPEDHDKEVRRLAKIAHNEIDKYADIGSFVFSKEFYEKLRAYQNESDEAADLHQDWVGYLLDDNEITKKYLSELIVLAKKDLQTNEREKHKK
ncbi:MAG: hypothetical protein KZQ73_05625 [Candidatus Thiodiazotropha sp. (ex Semelilucina semeliformis)]|nr:hypothetical protein [Candidatus Thiodiazotropha sp. (ex Semelilucina semeliformis)]